MLRSNCKMCETFREYFRDRFARLPDFPIQVFHSYLADFLRLQDTKATGCKGLVTEFKVRDELKQVGLNKLQGLDGLLHEGYLRISQMFVPIMTDVFNQWFSQGAIPGSVLREWSYY